MLIDEHSLVPGEHLVWRWRPGQVKHRPHFVWAREDMAEKVKERGLHQVNARDYHDGKPEEALIFGARVNGRESSRFYQRSSKRTDRNPWD